MKIRILPPEVHRTPDELDALRLPAIKAYLKAECEFSDADWRLFFRLYEFDWRGLCTIYQVAVPVKRRITIDDKHDLLLGCLAGATRIGPQSSRIQARLGNVL